MSVNGALVEAKMCTIILESTYFIFNECPIYTHDGARPKFSTHTKRITVWDRENGNLFLQCNPDTYLLSKISNFILYSGELCSPGAAAVTACRRCDSCTVFYSV